MTPSERQELTPDELADQHIAELPVREALTLISPGGSVDLIGETSEPVDLKPEPDPVEITPEPAPVLPGEEVTPILPGEEDPQP